MSSKLIEKDAFTFEVTEKNGEKHIKIVATDYYRHWLKFKTKVGDKGTMYLTFLKPSRSSNQLRYYFVLVGLLADSLGYTRDELHDVLVSIKFGTKKIKVFGKEVEVRKSISDASKFPTADMIDLISFTQEKCFENDVVVPSAESLGYISNHGSY